MAKKAAQGKKMKHIHFNIDKNAFRGPYTCHRVRTRISEKKMIVGDIIFQYTVWQCPVCKSDYLDSEQSKKLELLWVLEKILKNDSPKLKRSLNFDGKMFFMRFPKEFTRGWSKQNYADIQAIDRSRFIVEIK